MTVTAMSLVDPARGLSYALVPSDLLKVGTWEVTPTVREVTEDRAQADGAFDTTAYLSSAAVTVELTATDSIRAVLDSIGVFLLPWARPYLVVTDDELPSPRQIQLRFDTVTHPYELPTYRSVQLAWKAPTGLWEDTAVQQYTLVSDVPDLTGMTFTDTSGVSVTDTGGYTFNPSTSAGDTLVVVGGNARPQWKVKLYGPCTGPKLTRDDTGQTFNFTDALVLAPGQYVELDFAALTANLLSDPNQGRLAMVDFSTSQWFPLDPGTNKLRYHATSGSTASTQAVLDITPAWMP